MLSTHWWVIPKYTHLDQRKPLPSPEPQLGKTAIPMVLKLGSPRCGTHTSIPSGLTQNVIIPPYTFTQGSLLSLRHLGRQQFCC